MRSPTVQFRITPSSSEGEETGSHQRAAEHIAELLNALTPIAALKQGDKERVVAQAMSVGVL